ncbi:MAG: allantoicase [Flavobacteriales bacterium]|nr:allantoicase [Flavobacteriales bacterium]
MEEPEYTALIDLAASKLGGAALSCSDDFFAGMENLTQPGRGIFIEGKYTDNGKWMDGWESRRKRTEGHDWCIIELATEGVIAGVDIDTNHFLGNHPPHASLEGANVNGNITDDVEWSEILAKSPLNSGDHNFYEIASEAGWTHVRLHIYPDGGVARLKVYGNVSKDWADHEGEVDLAAAINGGLAIGCNDMFFSHMNNLLMPQPGENMGDGWETKRNRIPNNVDWVIINLAAKGSISKVVIDTKHFKGNYPDRFSLEGCVAVSNGNFNQENQDWKELLPESKLEADREHEFSSEIEESGPFTHVRLRIYPDGGISRLRLFGSVDNS